MGSFRWNLKPSDVTRQLMLMIYIYIYYTAVHVVHCNYSFKMIVYVDFQLFNVIHDTRAI